MIDYFTEQEQNALLVAQSIPKAYTVLVEIPRRGKLPTLTITKQKQKPKYVAITVHRRNKAWRNTQ